MSKSQNITISNESSKIYIYNNARVNGIKNPKLHIESQNPLEASITIKMKSNYHIRIDNGFKNDPVVKEHTFDDPKSTTKSEPSDTENQKMEFSVNEDVLTINADDGKFYLGTIINETSGKNGLEYLVKFDDNTEKWSSSTELKKLNSSLNDSGQNIALCVVCKLENEADIVEVCDKCRRGYHRSCIKHDESANFSAPWCCSRCVASDIISISDSEDNETVSDTDDRQVKKKSQMLPYDPKSLHWDTQHLTNEEQKYCYCGDDGCWKDKMLQCCRCSQWFHSECIEIRNGLLLHGDRFFIFCCSICNNGKEFVRRLHINWHDLIHLVTYELSMIGGTKKYHSISKDIVPFLLKHWDELHLPFSMIKSRSKETLNNKISKIMSDQKRFKYNGEIDKTKGAYGLHQITPPVLGEKISLPANKKLSDGLLKSLGIKFVPMDKISTDKKCPDNYKEFVAEKRRRSDSDGRILSRVNTKLRQRSKTNVFERKQTKRRSNKKNDETTNDEKQTEVCDSSDETSSRSTLDWIIPPPKNFQGKNNPFHSQYKSDVKVKNATLKRSIDKAREIRIVRTIKRRLSAKDIMMGPNQEFKRRRVMKRRKSADIEIISEVIQPAMLPIPSHLPVRTDFKDISSAFNMNSNFGFKSTSSSSVSCSSTSMQGIKSLKVIEKQQQVVKRFSENNPNLTEEVMNSPIKNKCINMYFGAMHRIENGEKFKIMAKRRTFDGNEQYLLEWDTRQTETLN